MLAALGNAQSLVVSALWLAAVAVEVFALVDAARHRPDAYPAAGKRTKVFWVAILAVATLVGFVSSPLGMLGILAFVGAAVYLADVRPALRQVTGRGGRGGGGGFGRW
jgi:hypothetical protein